MLKATRDQVMATLKAVGLGRSDGVMVHSALQFLGWPEGGAGMYYEALDLLLGLRSLDGTLVVPTFNFGFAHGQPFDQAHTPAEELNAGTFPEYIRQRPEAKRSPHPLQSVAAVGAWADDLSGRDTSSAFDPGSAFDRMLELDFTLVLLGASVDAISMLHYVEQRLQVPYRFWKKFTGEVTLPGRPPEVRTYRMYARYRKLNPQLDYSPIQAELERRGGWSSTPLNYGTVAACRARDFVAVAEELIRRDPWVLVKNRPK
jgi:aminoglycoside 3-N-acetyltransferase